MIELHSVTKSYPTPHGRRYVFRDLSFSFPEGASVGLIGPNGAGKSTLMRLLGGIDTPDSGFVRTDVNISWPVGLAGGFQGSLSGRDNAKFVCRINGAVGDAMREKIRFVEEFADIGEYFDLPVKSYSSGMRSRLGFGLSMAFDFDYYLIDEVMAVGDAQFRTKCHAVFRSKLQRAKLILVSHNMKDIGQWCDVVVLINRGTATLYENVNEGIAAYQGKPKPARAASKPSVAKPAAKKKKRVPAKAAADGEAQISGRGTAAAARVEPDGVPPPSGLPRADQLQPASRAADSAATPAAPKPENPAE